MTMSGQPPRDIQPGEWDNYEKRALVKMRSELIAAEPWWRQSLLRLEWKLMQSHRWLFGP
jgi:hypothetical protein